MRSRQLAAAVRLVSCISALEVAKHLLAQAATGERDLDQLKEPAFNRLGCVLIKRECQIWRPSGS
jgi:hypothetical protein